MLSNFLNSRFGSNINSSSPRFLKQIFLNVNNLLAANCFPRNVTRTSDKRKRNDGGWDLITHRRTTGMLINPLDEFRLCECSIFNSGQTLKLFGELKALSFQSLSGSISLAVTNRFSKGRHNSRRKLRNTKLLLLAQGAKLTLDCHGNTAGNQTLLLLYFRRKSTKVLSL